MGTRFKSSNPEHQIYEDAAVLHAGETVLVTGTGTVELELPGNVRGVVVQARQSGAGSLQVLDLLDLYLQTRVPCGSGNYFWVDVAHFTQCTGTVATFTEYAKVAASLDQAHFDVVGDALAADAVRHVIGDKWRARWVVFDGGGAHSFWFSLRLQPS